jgi:plastocyanin domain-containing protein
MKIRNGIVTLVALGALASGCSSSQQAKSEAPAGGSNRVEIAVTEDGFVPASVTVAAGQPVTMVVTRQTDKTCATELVLKEHNINQILPLNQAVEITFTPEKAGTLTYACGMDMIKGTVVVQ